MRKTIICLCIMLALPLLAMAKDYSFGKGRLNVKFIANNAVRICYEETSASSATTLPDWVYVSNDETSKHDVNVNVNDQQGIVEITNKQGVVVFRATRHQADKDGATLTIDSPTDEYLYGLGQFQDGYSNIRGLSRRLTQVNTQISVPMMISSKGYGLLWNQYGLTEFNPSKQNVTLIKQQGSKGREVVNVTSTEGGRQEVRERNIYEADIVIDKAGDYSLLLDVGQKMARRHHLCIDDKIVIDMQNLWLPPTTSTIVHLEAGKHRLSAELSNGDKPVVHYHLVKNETTFYTPIAKAVDYTVFVGNPDEIIASYRQVTGNVPMLPIWAMGYIHCRERFHSQEEILSTANRFRNEQLPIDMIVQDWQYWGKYGWNSMKFDEAHYPSPKSMTDSLHRMNMRLMVSVWSKIDKNSEVGKQMLQDGFYIPQTDWIDFFNPQAANAYWRNFSQRLLPLGIDAWWQDATEPENDDLTGRKVKNGEIDGDEVRNVYPLLVNKTVYEGLRKDAPEQRPMILTRCGFSGIQRYGSALWSGDVGNDWETFRRQITAGLGLQATGLPWWTYDAGGFFRPRDQYSNNDYIERMLRWIQTSVYLPLMRVHGYMSDTEPWRYGKEAQAIIHKCLQERYRLLPYIYSNVAEVSFAGSTLMRPLVFDFANDYVALQQKHEYMFGKSLLVSPVTQSLSENKGSWQTYLPIHHPGWYDYRTGKHYEGGKTITTSIDLTTIPIFVKAGSILPIGADKQYTKENLSAPMEIRIFPGANATFDLYEDDGESNRYEKGECSRISLEWDNAKQQLTIGSRKGSYKDMPMKREFIVTLQGKPSKTIAYKGKKVRIRF